MGTQRAALDYNKLSFILILGAVFYNEFFVYFSAYNKWPSLSSSDDCIKILFVADPQIQGLKYERPFPIGAITRWDSDRYLSKTFSWAVFAYNPQIVVFLGDLLDEGSDSDDETFHIYAERFKEIYNNRAVKTTVYVPGDNDIGGEGGDPVTDNKISRFKDEFSPKKLYRFKGTSGADLGDSESETVPSDAITVEIIPASLLTHRDSQEYSEVATPGKNTFRLVVSHLPVMPTQNGQFAIDVLTQLKPSVIFSAHDHKGMDYIGTKKTGKSNGTITFFSQQQSDSTQELFLIQGGDHEVTPKTDLGNVTGDPSPNPEEYVHEIVVPTCSYRMGVREMAFGLGVINMKSSKSMKLQYGNLWLPSRFALLYIYVATFLCVVVLLCMGRCQTVRRGRRNSRSGRRSASGSPSPGIKYSKLV